MYAVWMGLVRVGGGASWGAWGEQPVAQGRLISHDRTGQLMPAAVLHETEGKCGTAEKLELGNSRACQLWLTGKDGAVDAI